MGISIELLAQLRDLEKELHHYKDQLADYEEFKKMPEAISPPQPPANLMGLTIMDLVKIIMNNRPYIAKNKEKPERKTEVDRRMQENQTINDLLSRLGTLDELING